MAVVRADSEKNCIQIMVTGKERKVFLALLWLAFRELHTGFAGLKVSERIPMPDNPAITVDYESLLNSQQEGIPKIFPEGAKAYEVKALLLACILRIKARERGCWLWRVENRRRADYED